MFETKHLPVLPDVIAPDGSQVRILLQLAGGSMAHFELAPGRISRAVSHKTVEEIWYFVAGQGEMWRRQASREQVVTVKAGVCITIPIGTTFQFRTRGHQPLKAIAITMPPWPGDGEAVVETGIWPVSLE